MQMFININALKKTKYLEYCVEKILKNDKYFSFYLVDNFIRNLYFELSQSSKQNTSLDKIDKENNQYLCIMDYFILCAH